MWQNNEFWDLTIDVRHFEKNVTEWLMTYFRLIPGVKIQKKKKKIWESFLFLHVDSKIYYIFTLKIIVNKKLCFFIAKIWLLLEML